MRENKSTKLISWVLWKPLQFSALFVALTIACAAVLFGSNIRILQIASPIITLVLGIFLLIRMLPSTTYINRRSFILTTNTIWIIGTLVIALITPFVSAYQVPNMIETPNWFMTMLGILITLIAGIYALGLTVTALYLTYRRLRTLNVPAWKIIFAYPIGVSALTAMSYILDTPDNKTPNIETKLNRLNKLTDWTMARTRNAILMYSIVLLATNLFTNKLIALLLSVIAILIMALAAINVGQKKFIKNLGNKYASICVVINLFIVIATSLYFTLMPTLNDNVIINPNAPQPSVEQNI